MEERSPLNGCRIQMISSPRMLHETLKRVAAHKTSTISLYTSLATAKNHHDHHVKSPCFFSSCDHMHADLRREAGDLSPEDKRASLHARHRPVVRPSKLKLKLQVRSYYCQLRIRIGM
ncbi:hypothetical protein CY34DRAFT_805173 [Suillus luteus UH-Slu-Lm8-n1]|uniref:Uncharacterized protein n=1 Tax=Suillus luteus UH-Slu-Lm8-n1 TaxID=930992 RepID=A0A0C9ZWK8_9AGAM|nr:hypothetical protein CY34DRAFT_805173 [Suillus luteus UH-Slu-Lm8-n1]